MSETQPQCLYCGVSDAEAPLVFLKYQGKEYWICPQHLPILIHEPNKLAGRLPGADNVKGAGHH